MELDCEWGIGGNPYVEEFIKKIIKEAPEVLKFEIRGHKCEFNKLRSFCPDSDLVVPEPTTDNLDIRISFFILSYMGIVGAQIVSLEIKKCYMSLSQTEWLEIYMENKKITSLNFNKVGLTKGQSNVELSQIICFSNRDSNNPVRRHLACSLLKELGLLKEVPGKAVRWYAGKYDTPKRQWLKQNTSEFFKNIFELSIVLAYIKGYAGIDLYCYSTELEEINEKRYWGKFENIGG